MKSCRFGAAEAAISESIWPAMHELDQRLR